MSKIYQSLIRPILFRFPTESAHEFGINFLKLGLGPDFIQRLVSGWNSIDPVLESEQFGLKFPNPIGIAAGFDKNGIVVNQLSALGFGFVEVGTLTFEPQKGNEKPRMFRLPKDHALINRLGFNNQGVKVVAERLKNLDRKCVVGVNIGKNKDVPNENAIDNYIASFDVAFDVADYIAVNVSSPNTPNLRELQKPEDLESLLSALQNRNDELSRGSRKPLFVKIAPDLSDSDIREIANISLKMNLAGIIATNTTISRAGLRTNSDEIEKIGNGGLSGKPLVKRSNEVIQTIYEHSKGALTVIGVGGVFSAQDAFEKVVSGASLLQAYTGFVYQGPGFARSINHGLSLLLKENGFAGLDDAVGSACKLKF